MARQLARLDSGYSFLAYDDAAEALDVVAVKCEVIRTEARPWNHPGGDLFEHVRLPLLGRQVKADVYHGTFNVLPVLPWLSPAPRMVVTMHDVAPFKMPEAYSKQFGVLARFLTRMAVRRADHIIAISSATRSDLIELFPLAASKTSVILNGVGEEFVAAADLPQAEVASVAGRLGLPARYVLYVGNLERKKNLPRLISAIQKAKAAAGLPHRLVIVGSRPQGVPAADLTGAIDDGLVVFTGALPDADLPAVYRGAELLAYPSLYEGFGMPVLEAMAAGVPVLTSTVSSLPEVAGGAAILVDPLNVDSIAGGLVTALIDGQWRAAAVNAGRSRAKNLTWERNARETADVYRKLMDLPA